MAQKGELSGTISDTSTNKPIANAEIFIEETGQTKYTNNKGIFLFSDLDYGKYTINIFATNYTNEKKIIEINQEKNEFNFNLSLLKMTIDEVVIKETSEQETHKLNNVENFALYAGKKTELIEIEKIQVNVASNNPRQIFKGIAGLNIQENDGAGLQLSIGGRGLDPNRTANFNTRQNGYDISADALGYPESYYTPPVQALRRIEVVRGAASLQFGTQFGGLLNFVFKDKIMNTHLNRKRQEAFSLTTEQTYGSFGLFNSFNSIGGSLKNMNYYSFYQYKKSDGQRPNSSLHQQTAFAKINWTVFKKLKIGLEYTYMNYLSQQAGGLMDFEFEQDPYQSKRERNWFAVNWNLAAFYATYKFNDKLKLNNRTFFLLAGRDALGDLGPINRPDPLRERDLILGKYKNIGNELRLQWRYSIKDKENSLLIGNRIYRGFAASQQGDADDGSDANFNFIDNNSIYSDYEFPSKNVAFFVENLFNISDKWTLTPGIRWEYISTAAEGFYTQRVFSGGQIIFEQQINEARGNNRSIFLSGIGTGYKPNDDIELYANFSQNYRSINFTDLTVQNPNLLVDSLLQDERGYNIDFGLRGNLKEKVYYDMTAFLLMYKNRIGVKDLIISDPILIEKTVDYRTNIGNARILGLEMYAESNLIKYWKEESDWACRYFINFSAISGKYTSGTNDIIGNQVELIPPINLKTGVNISWKSLKMALQYSYVHQHFSDATNAEFISNATRGWINSYQVMDFSAAYQWKFLTLSGGIDNLLNEKYFTRRTASYPGPGIIPALGRSFYVGLKVEI